jgi:chaperone required for assembly of F1-ATPase
VTQSEPGSKPRRFYKAVEAAPVDTGFGLQLDGRNARTPGGKLLLAPTQRLARLLADEWEGQGEEIDFNAMPATRLAFTTLDRGAEARDGLAQELARYAGSDLICYLTEEPRALAERESAVWAPWIDWAKSALGVVLVPSVGIAPARQSPEALERIRALGLEMEDFALTGLAFAAGLYGSAILAFAVERGALSGMDAFEASRLEEAFQEERWGLDAEAAARTERLRSEAILIHRWFEALGG